MKKELIIIAGPNGSGKSTLAEMLLAEKHFLPFVNADTIAKGISGSSERTDISAGRMMIARINSALADNESIAFETTLSGRTWVRLIRQALDKGYQVTLGFIAVSSVEEAISRVGRRVLEGGHSIPSEVILRRYPRSLSMFFNVYRDLVSQWFFFDNTGNNSNLVAYRSNGHEIVLNAELYAVYQRQISGN